MKKSVLYYTRLGVHLHIPKLLSTYYSLFHETIKYEQKDNILFDAFKAQILVWENVDLNRFFIILWFLCNVKIKPVKIYSWLVVMWKKVIDSKSICVSSARCTILYSHNHKPTVGAHIILYNIKITFNECSSRKLLDVLFFIDVL